MRRLALVFAGGFCGTLARYLLAPPLLALALHHALPGAQSGFPYDIFFINLTGAIALGLLYGLSDRGVPVSSDARLLLGTGFLGGYTTFSTYEMGGAKLIVGHAPWLATVYLAGSIVLGVLCARLGLLLAGLFATRATARASRAASSTAGLPARLYKLAPETPEPPTRVTSATPSSRQVTEKRVLHPSDAPHMPPAQAAPDTFLPDEREPWDDGATASGAHPRR